MKQVIFILSLFFAFACEKNDNISFSESNYPTVYKPLNSTELTQAREAYFRDNPYLQSSINEFGFCDFSEINRGIDFPPASEQPTEAEAKDLVRDFILKNSSFTGVDQPEAVTFAEVKSSQSTYNNQLFWHIKTSNQKVDTIEVLQTSMVFHTWNNQIYYCTGNWYPKVYIPSVFNFNKEIAKEMLLNKEVWHSTIDGKPYSVKITFADLAKSQTRLVVFPVEVKGRIELRVTWEIEVPDPVYYKFYVDVVTGEVIQKEPTIIS